MVTPESLGTQAVSNVISVSSGGQSKRNGGQVLGVALTLPARPSTDSYLSVREVGLSRHWTGDCGYMPSTGKKSEIASNRPRLGPCLVVLPSSGNRAAVSE